jgi:O-acetyl-ADP-ribose deacetylase (regulator of RNase III)/NAD-dependent SIR2 family protein deacetylase
MQAHTSALKAALLSVLRQEHSNVKELPSLSTKDQRTVLGDLLIASNTHWKEETLGLIDQLWSQESSQNEKDGFIVDLENLPGISNLRGTAISIFRGDITTLRGTRTAIVNAANDQGLGCFVPNHRCIDNVIHRRSGPRLRLACEAEMKKRGSLLSAGTPAIVTGAFHLPSQYVVHVTGPQVGKLEALTDSHRALLAKAYENSLDAAVQAGAKSIVFPCISTGLFGFPSVQAVPIALRTVQSWLLQHPNRTLDSVVFNTFEEKDEKLYKENIHTYFPAVAHAVSQANTVVLNSFRDNAVAVAKQWIDDADAVLICAGAGMSGNPGEMVYTNPEDFVAAYPWFVKWGYKTNYEVMGLGSDPSVPMTAKWALYAKHMDNMRWKFEPNQGYQWLKDLIKEKNHFVLTSNVDACFERSGFDKSRIYTPQGEWTYMQCKTACRRDSVFKSRPHLDAILPHISKDGFIPDALIPKCPNCGGGMFGNVRADGSYLHLMYEQQNIALQQWMQSLVNSSSTAKVVVLEIGAGFNTPTVTRFPMESFVRHLGNRGSLIRINPSDPEVPMDLPNTLALEEGWQILGDMRKSQGISSKENQSAIEHRIRQELAQQGMLVHDEVMLRYKRHLGHFDWKIFLNQLKDR